MRCGVRNERNTAWRRGAELCEECAPMKWKIQTKHHSGKIAAACGGRKAGSVWRDERSEGAGRGTAEVRHELEHPQHFAGLEAARKKSDRREADSTSDGSFVLTLSTPDKT